MAPDLPPGALTVPVLQHCALSSHRLGLDGMKMQVKCCRSSPVTEGTLVFWGSLWSNGIACSSQA